MEDNSNNVDLPLFPPIEEIFSKVEIQSEPMVIFSHTVHLDQDIEDPKYYRQLHLLLKSASCFDEITFIINTNGGYSDTMIQIIHAIQETQANTTAEVYKAYSAGSGIALACNSMAINPYSKMMIHSGSYGISGKGSDVKSLQNFQDKYDKELFTNIYKNFLTQKEIDDVMGGKELYFTSQDILDRIPKLEDEEEGVLCKEENPRKTKKGVIK